MSILLKLTSNTQSTSGEVHQPTDVPENEPEAPPNISEAARHVKRLLARIHIAHVQGQRKEAIQLSHLYLQSYYARYLAVVEARKTLLRHQRPPVGLLASYAWSLNAWTGTQEGVWTVLVPNWEKPNGFRITLEYGLENKALQLLVYQLLKAQADLHHSQYLLRGGTHAAINRVVRLVEAGYVWAFAIDIRKCYQSFDGEKVSELLPIPKEVTQRVLLSSTHNILLPSHGDEDKILFDKLSANARLGLPEGSAASPLVAQMLLSSLFHGPSPCGKLVAYGDNILALGKSYNDLVSMSLALRGALKRLSPKSILLPKSPQPIRFVGHVIQTCDGTVQINPSPENLDSFEKNLHTQLAAIQGASSAAARKWEIEKAQRHVHQWTAAFRLCSNISSVRQAVLERFKAM